MTHITQILISDDENQNLPEVIEYSTGTIKKLYPECEYTLYNNSMLREFISQHFKDDVLHAYDSLVPYAAKCDLARLCISYVNGGWYSDITIKHISRLENYLDYDFICFYDAGDILLSPDAYKFSLLNGFYYTKPNNIILLKSIESILDNCKSKYYGECPICPTGPGNFGLNYAKYGHLVDNKLEGIFTSLTPQYEYKNRSYVLPNGWIVAQNKCAWYSGDILEFGLKGVNNYVDLWHQKMFYS